MGIRSLVEVPLRTRVLDENNETGLRRRETQRSVAIQTEAALTMTEPFDTGVTSHPGREPDRRYDDGELPRQEQP